MKANMPVAPAGPKTARLHKQRPRHRCRRCPYYGPWGQCFDLRRKSGRCGDWVWYMRGAKQWRHLYVQPRDPRTPAQRYWRAKFGAASRKYSQSLTQEERRACIAAGSKLRSRSRLGQSGPLNGQHYSIRLSGREQNETAGGNKMRLCPAPPSGQAGKARNPLFS
jgi:hypothetical protein